MLAAVVWCQEEPQNMGAWTFVKPRFENLIGKKVSLQGETLHENTSGKFSQINFLYLL